MAGLELTLESLSMPLWGTWVKSSIGAQNSASLSAILDFEDNWYLHAQLHIPCWLSPIFTFHKIALTGSKNISIYPSRFSKIFVFLTSKLTYDEFKRDHVFVGEIKVIENCIRSKYHEPWHSGFFENNVVPPFLKSVYLLSELSVNAQYWKKVVFIIIPNTKYAFSQRIQNYFLI